MERRALLLLLLLPACVHPPRTAPRRATAETVIWRGDGDRSLASLRERHRLESQIDRNAPEMEQLVRLRRWVHDRWSHDSWNEPASYDALTILRQAAEGKRFRCVEYSIVLAQVYRALGWPARLVRLQGPRGAHVLAEVHARRTGKWILMDAQMDVHVTRAGAALSVLEFRDALRRDGGEGLRVEGLPPPGTGEKLPDYRKWCAGYLDYLMYPRELTYGRQLAALHVLMDVGAHLPPSKPPYLVRSKTRYISTVDPRTVYPRPPRR